eukprot:COSAG01_NODE_421_length_17271_cov_524.391218_15_plen_64_part_00
MTSSVGSSHSNSKLRVPAVPVHSCGAALAAALLLHIPVQETFLYYRYSTGTVLAYGVPVQPGC